MAGGDLGTYGFQTDTAELDLFAMMSTTPRPLRMLSLDATLTNGQLILQTSVFRVPNDTTSFEIDLHASHIFPATATPTSTRSVSRSSRSNPV